jgi:hypothetical protein
MRKSREKFTGNPPVFETQALQVKGTQHNPVDGFAEEDFRGSEIPGDTQKVEGSTFCKANRTCAKAPF